MSSDTPDFMSTVLLLFLWMCTIIEGTILFAHLILPSVSSEAPISPLVFFFTIFLVSSIISSKHLYPNKYSRVLMNLASCRKLLSHIADGFSQVLRSLFKRRKYPQLMSPMESLTGSKIVQRCKTRFLSQTHHDEEADTKNRLPLPNQGTPGDTARENGELQKAINIYEEALDKYGQADGLTGEQEALRKEKITETKNKLDTVRERKERINAVRNPLQNAESSFQTAVSQHAQSNIIPARRDYRQARDQYDKAVDMLTEFEEDIFEKEDEITVSVNLESEYLPSRLGAWDNLSDDEQETLSDAGIGTLSDIRNADPELIQDLVKEKPIDGRLVNRLSAVKWWHGEEERTFTSRTTIERQRDRAKEGFQMLS